MEPSPQAGYCPPIADLHEPSRGGPREKEGSEAPTLNAPGALAGFYNKSDRYQL